MKLPSFIASLRPLSPAARSLLRSGAVYAGLVLLVAGLWCAVYGRVPGTDVFRIPVEYHGDGMSMSGIIKGFAELPPPWNLHIQRLNAPYGADWNDYPHPEKLLFYTGAVLARILDLGAAVNVLLMLGFMANATAFCWSARRLGSAWAPALCGSIMFAFSAYTLWRGLPHIILLYAWHVPILFYLYHRVRAGEPASRALWIGGSLYVWAAAFLNPYYYVFVMLVLVLVALRLALTGSRRELLLPAAWIGQGLLAFAVNQSNVILYRWRHGPNAAFLGRNLHEQMVYGLRLPDLFMPDGHPFKGWADFAHKSYFVPGIGNENTAAFLGLAGCAGLLVLLALSVARGMRGQGERIPFESWFVLVAYLLGATGGGALLMGAFGFSWLRASARYSIVILCAVLLWAARAIPLSRHRALVTAAMVLLAAFTVVESRDSWAPRRRPPDALRVAADRAFAADLERQLPRAAAVFQVPVMTFPENGPLLALTDYEPFRPYYWSSHLRFSYGAHGGRAREQWQKGCAAKPVPAMVAELRERGFSAIIIHRAGFRDRGAGLEAALAAGGAARIAGADTSDMAAYRLP